MHTIGLYFVGVGICALTLESVGGALVFLIIAAFLLA